MIKTQALLAPARPRASLTALFVGAAVCAVIAPQAQPIAAALASLNGAQPARVVRGSFKPIDFSRVRPFFLRTADPAERERAVHCMTDAIYYEAAREPEEGQRAVAQVVLNRVRDQHFPKSICGVVYQGWERRTGCQFSFTCDGSITRRHADAALWNRLRPIAEQALGGYVMPKVGTATHYYATYVRPNWVRTVAQVTEIGKHVFCSWKGKAGLPTALRQPYAGGELQVAQAALDGARANPVGRGARHHERYA